MKFVPGIHYTENLEIRFGDAPPEILRFTLRDGRAANPLMVAHLRKHFDNLNPASKDKAEAECLEDDTGRVWQVRMLTERGVNLDPSKTKGAGRQHDDYELQGAFEDQWIHYRGCHRNAKDHLWHGSQKRSTWEDQLQV